MFAILFIQPNDESADLKQALLAKNNFDNHRLFAENKAFVDYKRITKIEFSVMHSDVV